MTDNNRRAKNKYKSKIVVVRIELYPTDNDIKSIIANRKAAGEPTATFIKRLIRAEDKSNG